MPKRLRNDVALCTSKKKKLYLPKDKGVTSEDDPYGNMSDMYEDDHQQKGRGSFLTKLIPENLVIEKKSKKKKKEETFDASFYEEARYEKVPQGETKGTHYLLPLKADHGQLIQQEPTLLASKVSVSEESDVSIEESSSPTDISAKKNSSEVNVPQILTTADLFSRRQEKLDEKKESIAFIASQLMENPEANIGQLKQLRMLCFERDPDVAITIRKLAMVSFMAVIKDIAPSYHIRELTESEKSVKVSKDVKKLRHFEQTLLLDYQLFLSQCDETIRVGLGIQEMKGEGQRKKRRERKKPVVLLEDGQELSPSVMESLAEVALRCLCDLILSLPHFNFRNSILASLVPLMPSNAIDKKVSKMCCATIEKLFQNDLVGDVSFEAVQFISRMVKAKSYKTKPVVLQTFLHLHLHDVDNPVAAAGSRTPVAISRRTMTRTKEERKKETKQRLSKKQRKRLRAEAKLDKDLQEASAIESRERRSKIQTEILKIVFLTYFRILKHSRHSPLLQPVLQGLAKFAHLINVDFFADLMSVLHSLAETGGMSNKECMQCVLTAFEILSGQGSALNIDLRQFYTQLYGAILQLDACSTDSDVLLAVDCLDKLIRNLRTQRVLGFVKRLSTITLQLLPGAALSVLAMLKKFFQMYSQCEQLLDVDGVMGSGVYRPDVPDPEMSCSSSTCLWELAHLRFHYDPTVVTYAKHLLHGAPSQGKESLCPDLARKTPKDLLLGFSQPRADFHTSVLEFANVPHPPPHPALKLERDYHYKNMGILSADIKERIEKALEVVDKTVKQLEGSI